MSTPTTARGALLRRAGTLLAAAALVAAPATSALAEPTPTPDPSVTASPSPSPSATSSATVSPSATTPADPTQSASPTASPSTTLPSPDASPSEPPSPASTSSPPVARLSASSLLAATATAAPEAAHAADFIARTLATGKDHYVYPGGAFFDGGNTIDAILALDGALAGSTQANASFAYLEDHVAGYMGAQYGSTYAGPTAKALLAVVAHGGDPTHFGTINGKPGNLVTALRATEGAVEPGRFSDLPVDCGYSPCDYSNTIGQSLAIVALLRAGEKVSATSVEVLLSQQCADGGFRGTIGSETCSSDPDATAFAAQALIAAGSNTAAGKALDHLTSIQRADGSVRSADGIANANTTGVAAQAFAAGDRHPQLAVARSFLVSLQYGCTSPAALRGGLAFSPDKRSTTAVQDSDLRATPQGTLALSGNSLLSVGAVAGAATGTTALPCGRPVSTPTTTTPSTSAPAVTSGAGGTGAGAAPVSGGDPVQGDTASAPTGSLAQTGSDVLLPVGLGLALVLVGAVAVAASRRRGAHA